MKLKILVLTRDVRAYKAAFYQSDFLVELAKQHTCVYYGPGFLGFNEEDSAETVLRKTQVRDCPHDLIVVAHSWLADTPNGPISPMRSFDLKSATIPAALLLNKEYTRLSEKLDWAESSSIDAVFSHHHEIEQLARGRAFPAFFLPFAFSHDRFGRVESEIREDFGFTGILQNPSNSELQGKVRAEVQSELFHSFLDIPLIKRNAYRNIKIQWRSWTGNRVKDIVSAMLLRPRASEKKYVSLISETGIWLNGPSPLGLISTRYFECMAVGAIVLTSSTPGLDRVFPEDTYVEFSGVKDFREKLLWLLGNPNEASQIRNRAKKFVYLGHTWSHRVQDFIKQATNLPIN